MRPKILLVDDVPANIDLLNATISMQIPDTETLVATSGVRALELIDKSVPDLVLLDIMMPEMDGLEVCRRIRSNPAYSSMPVIFVTASADDISHGFQAGGNDYITKPINTEEVIARVKHHLEKQSLFRQLESLNKELDLKVRERTAELAITNRQLREEIKERRFIQDRLQYLATHDFTTHLHNRNSLDDFICETINLAQVKHLSSYFLYIDLDRFRLINESCGCFAGDELLRQFADILIGITDRNDFVARLGGDRFAIVCRDKTDADGASKAELIDSAIRAFDFKWENRHFHLATSIALINIDSDIASFDQLMIMADEAIYHLRKNKLSFINYNDLQDHKDERSNINWALKLMDGLKQDEFRVYFQKIFYLKPNADKKYKIETLVRLHDTSSSTILLPDEFIPAAERYNIISDIDRWMIRNVVIFFGKNANALNTVTSASLNLSAITIREPSIVKYIQQLCEAYGLNPNKLSFEITETEAIVNMEQAKDVLLAIKELGCSLVLDDFGKGFSSFNYLQELPFDVVKIDGIFIRDMDKNNSHYGMVKSIVDIAKQLNKEVVAEYVESKIIADMLQELNVEFAQGYYYHKPEELTTSALQKL